MASLNSIAEQAFLQMFPNPFPDSATKKGEVLATAKAEYAYQSWKMWKEERATEGEYQVPSILLSMDELNVVNNEADISGFKILRSIPNDAWIQNIGGIGCDCAYIRTNVNQHQLLGDDNSIGDNARTYMVVGKKIVFPKGVHKTPLPFIYINIGDKMSDKVEVDDVIGGIVRSRLIEIYSGKTGNEDPTNNGNSNN